MAKLQLVLTAQCQRVTGLSFALSGAVKTHILSSMKSLEELKARMADLLDEAYGLGRRDAVTEFSKIAQETRDLVSSAFDARLNEVKSGLQVLAESLENGEARPSPGYVKRRLISIIASGGYGGVSDFDLNQKTPELNRTSRYMAIKSAIERGEIDEVEPGLYRVTERGIRFLNRFTSVRLKPPDWTRPKE